MMMKISSMDTAPGLPAADWLRDLVSIAVNWSAISVAWLVVTMWRSVA